MTVPGLAHSVDGYAVTLRTTIAGLPSNASFTYQLVVYVVGDGHHLAWILHADRYNAYRHGHCLDTAA